MTDTEHAPRRWSPNPVLARLAFGSDTRELQDPADDEGTDFALDLDDPGQRSLGEYELLEWIGQGGMGVVYRARQNRLKREVALKLLSAGPWASDQFVARFQQEAQHAARLQHPNIVTVYEIGEHRGLIYYAMEFVPGISLDLRLQRDGPMSPQAAAILLLNVAEAVDYAHRLGVLHLDLKPGNVLIAADGTAKIADFGLARRFDRDGGVVNDRVSGTPGYIAPEQAEVGTGKLDRTTDVWGLGTILYEALTGEPPFAVDSSRNAFDEVRNEPLRAPGELRHGIPADLDAICRHCLNKPQQDRYPSARALADDLRRFLEGRPVSVRPLHMWQRCARWMRRDPRLAAAGALAVVALVAGMVATSVQWLRAERSAADAREQTWDTRSEAAWRLVQEGRNFDAVRLSLDNLREREASGDRAGAALERLRLGTLENSGAQLIDAIATGGEGWAVALDPDGTRVAAVVEVTQVRLFDVHDGRELWRSDIGDASHFWQGRSATRLGFSRDGRRVIAESSEPSAVVHPSGHDNVLLDAATGKVLLPPPQHFADFRDATYSADGQYAVLRNTHWQAQLFRVAGWQPLTPLRRFDNVNGMWRVGDGGRFVAVNAMRRIELWDPRTFATRATFEFPPGQELESWAVQPDGPILAVGHVDGAVHLIDTDRLQMRTLAPTPYDSVNWLSFSPDGRWLGAITADRAFVWDVASGEGGALPARQGLNPGTRIELDAASGTVFAFNPPEATLWALPQADTLAQRVANARMRVPQFALGLGLDPHAAAVAPAARLAASIEWGGELRLWRWPGDGLLRARATVQNVAELYFDGQHVPAVEPGGVRVIAIDDERPASPLFAHPQPVSLATLSPDGQALVTVCGREIRVFDWRVGRLRFAPIRLGNSPLRIALGPDSAVLLATTGGYANGAFREFLTSFDLRTGVVHATGTSVPGPMHGLRFDPSGRRLVHRRYGEVAVLDAITLQPVGKTLRFGPDMAASLRRIFGENGTLADEYRDGTPVADAAIWSDGTTLDVLVRPKVDLNARLVRMDLGSGRTLRTRELSNAEGLQLLPRGKEFDFIAWSPSGARWLDSLGGNRPLPQVEGELQMAQAVSRDGRWFADSSAGGVQLVDRDSGQWAAAPLIAHLPRGDVIAQLAFAPDGDRLLARTHHGRWLWWPLPRETQPPDRIGQRFARLRPSAVPDTRLIAKALPSSERAALRVRDPGPPPPARAPQPMPPPPAAKSTQPALAFVDLHGAINRPTESLDLIHDDPIGYLTTVPLGVQRYLGVDYDIRGVVALQMDHGPAISGALPQSSQRVPAPVQRFGAVNVLLSGCCMLQGRPRVPYAYLVIGYADGGIARVPIMYHRHVWEPWHDPGDAIPARIAWVEPPPRALANFENPYRAYAARLANPHPDRDVATLGFEATDRAWSGPMILAATVETGHVDAGPLTATR